MSRFPAPLCQVVACGTPWHRPGRPVARLRPTALAIVLGTAALLGGCASGALGPATAGGQFAVHAAVGATPPRLTSESAQREAEADARRWLADPLQADDAVRLALRLSPAVQALMSDAGVRAARIGRAGRPGDPVLSFERLVRRGNGPPERDIGRLISVSLFDLLAWPTRQQAAREALEASSLRLTADLLGAATAAREAWIRAVAAQQSLQHAQQVLDAAEAATELARRLQAAGGFSRLQQAREQAFHADAEAQWAQARHAATATREALIRSLGLDDRLAQALRLPQRLPDLPVATRSNADLVAAALDQRLDLRLARSELQREARLAGLAPLESVFGDTRLGVQRNSEGGPVRQRGFELEWAIPLFDAGAAHRDESRERVLAAQAWARHTALLAGSQVREAASAAQTAYAVARHHRDTLLPLRQTIAEEMLLQYNGMLVDVFALLADARAQSLGVRAAIEAERDFWLADAALQATLLGASAAPSPSAPLSAGSAAPTAATAAH
jgi:outer membrane protein TolC